MFKTTISYHFDQCQCTHYHLAQYIPASHEQDMVSKSLLRFKQMKQNDFSGWINYARQEIRTVKWPQSGLIIRALHSYENINVRFGRKPLDYLGNALAVELGWKYTPTLIWKLSPTPKTHHFITKEQRQDELRDNYMLNPEYNYSLGTSVLVIDDIVTTVTTVKAILNTFKEVCPPENLTVFSLAQTGYDPDFNQHLSLKGNRYVYDPDDGWIDTTV